MRKLLLGAALLLSLQANAVEPDKLAHFGVAFGLTKVGNFISERAFRLNVVQAKIFTSVGMSCLILAKEYTDSKIDGGDILAGGVGMFTAHLVNLKFEF